MKAEVSGFGFLFSLPAVGGLLPPVAGRDGAAAEKFIFLELLSWRNALHYVIAFVLTFFPPKKTYLVFQTEPHLDVKQRH